jgi:HSP20 family protein
MQRWDPFREFEQLQEEMGRLMQSAWSPANGDGGAWTPFADVEETEDAWVIEAEVPGVKRDDVNVELRDDELVISGDVVERERRGRLRRRARRTGHFEYHVTLPGAVDEDRSRPTCMTASSPCGSPRPNRLGLGALRSRRTRRVSATRGGALGSHGVAQRR